MIDVGTGQFFLLIGFDQPPLPPQRGRGTALAVEGGVPPRVGHSPSQLTLTAPSRRGPSFFSPSRLMQISI